MISQLDIEPRLRLHADRGSSISFIDGISLRPTDRHSGCPVRSASCKGVWRFLFETIGRRISLDFQTYLAGRDAGETENEEAHGIIGHIGQVAKRVNPVRHAGSSPRPCQNVLGQIRGIGQDQNGGLENLSRRWPQGSNMGPARFMPFNRAAWWDRNGLDAGRTANVDAEFTNVYCDSRCKRVSTAPAEFTEIRCNSICKGRLRGCAAGTGIALGLG